MFIECVVYTEPGTVNEKSELIFRWASVGQNISKPDNFKERTVLGDAVTERAQEGSSEAAS